MFNINESPRRDITISGVVLSVIAPFHEGYVLRNNDAGVLNQTFAENIRNNMAATVKAEVEKAGGIQNLDRDALQSALDEYMADYDFGVKSARGMGARVPVDPVEREAFRIAREKVKSALAKNGYRVARGEEEPGGNILSKDKFEELVEAAVAQYPSITETARNVVAARSEAGKVMLSDLGISG